MVRSWEQRSRRGWPLAILVSEPMLAALAALSRLFDSREFVAVSVHDGNLALDTVVVLIGCGVPAILDCQSVTGCAASACRREVDRVFMRSGHLSCPFRGFDGTGNPSSSLRYKGCCFVYATAFCIFGWASRRCKMSWPSSLANSTNRSSPSLTGIVIFQLGDEFAGPRPRQKPMRSGFDDVSRPSFSSIGKQRP